MIGKEILHYRILEKLGEGGMGIVYKAEDTKLKRYVAIKFLPRHIAANSEERERFKIEAQAAAALNHPNIAHIYTIEEVGDETFIVMEYIDGQELKTKINEVPMQINEVLDIAKQIAEGLQTAHEQGIVHRDIKSTNIMLTTKGHSKIMDFGLAKVRGGALMTKVGTTIGTAAYMSPEQARGEEVDQRADIWSFGVVLFEMLSGELPFKGDYEQAVFYSILNEEPISLTERDLKVAPHLETLITKCLHKDTNSRYQEINQLLEDLNEITKSLVVDERENIGVKRNQITEKKNMFAILGIVALVVVVIGAGILFFTGEEKTKESSNLKQTQLESEKSLSVSDQKSIIVLPFSNISQDDENEYFSDGMTDELIDALAKIEKLRVVSRTSAFALKGKTQDIRTIGKQFNITHALEGSVRKVGNQIRISAQLVNVSNGYQMWSDKYDRQLADIFEIQDEIAGNIVRELKLILSDKEKSVLEKVPTKNIEAYDYYLRGKQYIYQGKKNSNEYAVDMFNKAIQIDPEFALAYTGIAEAGTWKYLWTERNNTVLKNAEQASLKALEIDPNLAEAHVSYGYLLSLSNNFIEASKEFDKAIELNPTLFDAYHLYARTCLANGQYEKFAKMIFKAHELQPENYHATMFLDDAYTRLGMPEEAKKAALKHLKIIENHLSLKPDDTRARILGAVQLVKMGDTKRATDWVNQVLEIDPESPSTLYNSACVFALSGQIERAIDLLEKQHEKNVLPKDWLENDSDLDALRDHPRFKKLMAKLK